MPGEQRRLDRLTDRNDQARQAKGEIDDWLAGRGSYVMLALAVALVVGFVASLVHL
ncbi:MAG: hypothetical protein ACYCR4_07375 [Acidimicrobiales bacterium]